MQGNRVHARPVYNIEVAEAHTYYVGKDARHCVLVHNDCGVDKKKSF